MIYLLPSASRDNQVPVRSLNSHFLNLSRRFAALPSLHLVENNSEHASPDRVNNVKIYWSCLLLTVSKWELATVNQFIIVVQSLFNYAPELGKLKSEIYEICLDVSMKLVFRSVRKICVPLDLVSLDVIEFNLRHFGVLRVQLHSLHPKSNFPNARSLQTSPTFQKSVRNVVCLLTGKSSLFISA